MNSPTSRRRNFSSQGTLEISPLQSGWHVAKGFFRVPQRRRISLVPSGLDFLWTVFQPLRSWLISDSRSATPFAVATLLLLFAAGATAETTNTLSDAEIQGRSLARQLCDSQPAESFTNTGVLQIRDSNGNRTNVPVTCKVIVTADHWQSVYESVWTNAAASHGSSLNEDLLSITHTGGQPNRYKYVKSYGPAMTSPPPNSPEAKSGDAVLENPIHTKTLAAEPSGGELMQSFAGSDFWVADLGLEFFHWPEQKVLPHTTPLRRGRSYTLLESTNPNPSTNGYSRVRSWIDKESGGILEAEAYDFNGKLLKDFEPKSFKKVDGQWQLQEMQIRNVQTGSRTRLKFDLNKQ